MLYLFLLLFAVAFYVGCLVVAALSAAGLAWGLLRRRWVLAALSAVALAVSAPGALYLVAVARSYGVPSWSAPAPLAERFEGPAHSLHLHPEGRYTLEAPDGEERGQWTALASTGDAVTSVAWTLTLAPDGGGPERVVPVRWDGVMGLDGKILRAE